MMPRLRRVCDDVESVVRSIESQAADRLWQAIDNWERALSEKSFLKRVEEKKAARDSRLVEVLEGGEVVDVFTPQREDYL